MPATAPITPRTHPEPGPLDTAAATTVAIRPRRWRRALLWGALLALLGVAQTLLVALTVSYESVRAQEEVDAVATEAAADIRHELLGAIQTLQALAWSQTPQPDWRAGAEALLKARPSLKRVEWRDLNLRVTEAVDTPFLPQLFSQMPRADLGVEAEVACNAARRAAAPMYSRSYFVPQAGALGLEVIDLCVPEQRAGREAGFLVGSFALTPILEAVLPTRQARRHEFSFVEADGTRLARAGVRRGAGVYLAERVVDLPGATLQLRADSGAGRPSLIPNLATALVLGLSIALFGVVLLLARDVRRRAQAESALAEALAFRKAMEDSLSTGLRARDMQGVISYVNPAFCAMVGFSADDLLPAAKGSPAAALPPQASQYAPPYWPPEYAALYQQRQQQRLEGSGRNPAELREGFETVFMRQNGERFPVMIYEAPLVDGQGRQTGWMSAVLDLSAQRRVEDISRQQQERLQATARLATVGEMASLLSHELNQPLAAIASYASGSLNLINDPAADTPGLLKQALERIAEQAERAGRVIKSVHDFVRRREQLHETLGADVLLEAVLPLARMHSRKSGTRIELDLPVSADDPLGAPARPPRVRCDRTMVEQVLLNLARNGIQAMEGATAPADRVLTLRVRVVQPGRATFSVIDRGPGIAADVAARLFTPFFTTRAEGMGLGLSLCRTVIEQHGGTLDFSPGPGGVGTEFRFTLAMPAPPAAAGVATIAAVENGETGRPVSSR
jgi:two-component system sensor histidine kinase DctS